MPPTTTADDQPIHPRSAEGRRLHNSAGPPYFSISNRVTDEPQGVDKRRSRRIPEKIKMIRPACRGRAGIVYLVRTTEFQAVDPGSNPGPSTATSRSEESVLPWSVPQDRFEFIDRGDQVTTILARIFKILGDGADVRDRLLGQPFAGFLPQFGRCGLGGPSARH